jgi:hypothetical protein
VGVTGSPKPSGTKFGNRAIGSRPRKVQAWKLFGSRSGWHKFPTVKAVPARARMTSRQRRSPELTGPGLEGETSADQDGSVADAKGQTRRRENGSRRERPGTNSASSSGEEGTGPNQPQEMIGDLRLACRKTRGAMGVFRGEVLSFLAVALRPVGQVKNHKRPQKGFGLKKSFGGMTRWR